MIMAPKMTSGIGLVVLILLLTGGSLPAEAQQGPLQYFTLTPCRVIDTRLPAGPRGGPALGPNATRTFPVRGACGVPSTARAITANVTVTGATAGSFLTLWPSGTPRPEVSTINFGPDDPALANGAVVPLSTDPNDLAVYNAVGAVHVIIDITGYFQ
jgi:hypothetical protein